MEEVFMLDSAIFRDTTKDTLGSDRTAGDALRHRQKMKDSVKGGIADLISEESIIGKSRDKIIKVPIRGVKEYRFIYGSNETGTGQGSGDTKSGDVLGKKDGQRQPGDRAGDQPGVDYYETEITLDELIEIMFEDLELPEMEKRALRYIVSERESRHLGYRKVGIRVRLDKKRTAKAHVRRKIASGYTGFREEFPEFITREDYEEMCRQFADFPFTQNQIKAWYYPIPGDPAKMQRRFPHNKEDLYYKHMEPDVKVESNAVVFCIMDTSGSMDTMKKYLARAFFFLLYQFVCTKYRAVEVIFIGHHTEGKEVTEEEFFHKGESGGTFISSGYDRALEVIKERYDPILWNIYAFHCSDGDNFESDNPIAVKRAAELCEVANLFGYGEIKPVGSRYYEGSMINLFKKDLEKYKNYHACNITKKEEVWSSFKEFLKHERVREV